MVDAPLFPVDWPAAVRLIESKYPPIDLFEDIADPEDWELLAAAEGKTNPRIAETIGNLDLVPTGRRVNGQGASYVMAPFTHCSPDKPRSEEHTSELQSLMRISYAVFCLKKKKNSNSSSIR